MQVMEAIAQQSTYNTAGIALHADLFVLRGVGTGDLIDLNGLAHQCGQRTVIEGLKVLILAAIPCPQQ